MNKSEDIKELASALALAQSQMRGATKDVANPFFKSKYADLSSVWDACREALTVNGLSVVQAARSLEAGVEVETMLLHASGQWISETLSIPVSKADAQGFGSALTYCRRYGLSAMVGVAPEDDDGNAAASAKPVEGDFKPKKAFESTHTPRNGAGSRISAEAQAKILKLANRVLDGFIANDMQVAYASYLDAKAEIVGDADAGAYFWDFFDSKQRTALRDLTKAEQVESIKKIPLETQA